MHNNPGKTMSIYNIPQILREALPLAATPNIIQSGLCMGVWSTNRNIVTVGKFLPCAVTDRPFPGSKIAFLSRLVSHKYTSAKLRRLHQLPFALPRQHSLLQCLHRVSIYQCSMNKFICICICNCLNNCICNPHL